MSRARGGRRVLAACVYTNRIDVTSEVIVLPPCVYTARLSAAGSRVRVCACIPVLACERRSGIHGGGLVVSGLEEVERWVYTCRGGVGLVVLAWMAPAVCLGARGRAWIRSRVVTVRL